MSTAVCHVYDPRLEFVIDEIRERKRSIEMSCWALDGTFQTVGFLLYVSKEPELVKEYEHGARLFIDYEFEIKSIGKASDNLVDFLARLYDIKAEGLILKKYISPEYVFRQYYDEYSFAGDNYHISLDMGASMSYHTIEVDLEVDIPAKRVYLREKSVPNRKKLLECICENWLEVIR